MQNSYWPWLVRIKLGWLWGVCLMLSAAPSQAFESPKSIEGVTVVTPFQLLELLQADPNVILIDVRAPASFERFKSIPGAFNISFGKRYIASEQIKKIEQRWPDRTTPLAVYCNGISCRRSSIAVVALREAGYTQIYWLREGVRAWRALQLPLD